MRKIMIFNLKYLMLPLSIMACINNNGNCMSERDIDTTNQQNIINDDTLDINNDGIFAADLIEIMRSFANENTEELSENAKNFIRQLAQHTSTNFENNNLDKEMFDKLLNNNEKLKWGQVFSCLYAGALKKYDVDYSKAYPNFLKSIRACCDKGLITEEQYNKLLDNLIQLSYNLLRYNLKKYFDSFSNGYSYRKKFYKVFNVDDNSKHDNSIFRVTKKVFNDYYRETFGFIKELVSGLIEVYINKYELDKEQAYLIDQIRQTIQEYTMNLIQDIICYESDKDKKESKNTGENNSIEKNNNTNIDGQINFVIKEIERQIKIYVSRTRLIASIQVFRPYEKVVDNGGKKTLRKSSMPDNSKIQEKTMSEKSRTFKMPDIVLNENIFHYLDYSTSQKISAIGSFITKINCNNNYNKYVFSKYICNIIEYYNKFNKLIQHLLQNLQDNEINNKTANILRDISENIKNINENITMKDLINRAQKLVQLAMLLENGEYNIKKKDLNQIIESINILIDFVSKIDKKDPGIMNLTLEQLIKNESEINTNSNQHN